MEASNLPVTISFEAVNVSTGKCESDEDYVAETKGIMPVEYGKISHDGTKIIHAGETDDYGTPDNNSDDVAYASMAGSPAWHYAIRSAGGTLFWDSDVETYTGFDSSEYVKLAVYKVFANINDVTEVQVEDFSAGHANGMTATLTFARKEGKAATGFWTLTDIPASDNVAPGSSTTLTVNVTSLNEGANKIPVGFVVLYCLGTSVTATTEIGVTVTGGSFGDILGI